MRSATKSKQVDLNSARKEQLKTIPGVDDATAEKIIAGRPYGSKAWLVTNKIIDDRTYAGIKDVIEAKQPYKDAARNAEMYEKNKKEKSASGK